MSTLEVQRPSGLQRSVSLPLSRERSPAPELSRVAGTVGRGRGGEGVLSENESLALVRSSPMTEEEPDSSAVETAASRYVYAYRRRGALRYNRRAFSQDIGGQGPHLSPYFRPHTHSSGPSLAALRAPVLAVCESARLEEEEERDLEQTSQEKEGDSEEEEEDEPNPLVESAKHKLFEQGHLSLLDVVDKMPAKLLESIVTDNASMACLEALGHRLPELKAGHLAHGDTDESRGAIHWFEGEGHSNTRSFFSPSSLHTY